MAHPRTFEHKYSLANLASFISAEIVSMGESSPPATVEPLGPRSETTCTPYLDDQERSDLLHDGLQNHTNSLITIVHSLK